MISDADAAVYERYADDLMRCASVVVGPAGAEDLVAETVLRVFSSAAWPGVLDRRSYLLRALTYQARSMHRSDVRRSAREVRSVGERVATVDSVRVEVLEAMRRLSVRQRAVVFFSYWEDLPVEQIAEVLAVSTRTVQRDLEGAQRRLEVLLQ